MGSKLFVWSLSISRSRLLISCKEETIHIYQLDYVIGINLSNGGNEHCMSPDLIVLRRTCHIHSILWDAKREPNYKGRKSRKAQIRKVLCFKNVSNYHVLQKVNVIKYKERLWKCSRLKETKGVRKTPNSRLIPESERVNTTKDIIGQLKKMEYRLENS